MLRAKTDIRRLDVPARLGLRARELFRQAYQLRCEADGAKRGGLDARAARLARRAETAERRARGLAGFAEADLQAVEDRLRAAIARDAGL